MLSKEQKEALRKAEGRYYNISPCSKCKTWEDSFFNGYLWFNDNLGSTHAIRIIEKKTNDDGKQ
ncbi:MAG: hypothetical protein PHV93_04625 [Candidatus Pacebacteria bacterium]|nr:hypothetical protein [Candidatus Paceibacterota bacterium]